MLRLLLDGREGGLPSRGIGRFVLDLARALPSASVDVTVLAPNAWPDMPGVQRQQMNSQLPGRWQRREHEWRLSRRIRRSECDVFHSPGVAPPHSSVLPWVQTLHDVAPLVLDHPQYVPDRARWRRHAARVRSADAIVAVSRWSAAQAIEVLDLDPARVSVVHHGVHPDFHPRERRDTAPYVAMVSHYDPRKGYREAMQAMSEVAARGLPHRLLIGGRIPEEPRRELEQVRLALPFPNAVEFVGHVDDLVQFYVDAELTLVSSRFEGFGFSALESMACGTPVVAFDNTATTEVVAGAGELVQDGDVSGLADAMVRVLSDAQLHGALVRRGLDRAADFSWGSAAMAYAEVYRAISRR